MQAVIQGKAGHPVNQLTDAQMRRYFNGMRSLSGELWTIGISLPLAVILGGIGQSVFAILCVVVAVGAGLLLYSNIKSMPTDQAFDQWLKEKTRELDLKARSHLQLQLEQRQRMLQPLVIHSFVLPDSELFNSLLVKEAYVKKGRDNKWRFSYNAFTYFYSTGSYLAVLTCCVNALDQSEELVLINDDLSYSRVISFPFSTDSSYAYINGKKALYSMRRLTVRVEHANDIKLSAYLNAKTIERNKQGVPETISSTIDNTQALAQLRHILRSQW